MTQPSGPGEEFRRTGSWAVRLVGLAGLAVLVVTCFGPVLFGGHQFVFRDAGNFYYPLYLAVQRQWHAGLWPLWEPVEDGGIPLLGSPQAAVLYPGKLIYAALPYAWAARIYIIAHVLLAFGATRAMLRSWEVSPTGATLAGFAYAFGAPLLFEYCNVIYLVGAAWVPLGFRAADAWLRLGRRWSVLELTLVLAMQALGGDLEAAYLTGLCAAGYAVGLTRRRPSVWLGLAGLVGALAVWTLVAPFLITEPSEPRFRGVRLVVSLLWVGACLVLLARGLRGRERSPLGARLLGLVVAAGLAIGLGAIQFVPVAENLALSDRWSRTSFDAVEDFSFVPYRVAEMVWPGVFGSILAGDHYWLSALPLVKDGRVWEVSVYFGVLPLALALGAFGFRGGPPWRAWFSALVAVGSVAALGLYLDPASWFGYPAGGSLYRLLTVALPGFGGFRYPSKLLVFVALALAGLAGAGWDRVVAGRTRWVTAFLVVTLILSLVLVGEVAASRGALVRTLASSSVGGTGSMFGPFDPRGVWGDLLWALGHGAVAAASALVVVRLARRRPVGAGLAAILVLVADLAITSLDLVFTLPQTEFDRPTEISRILAAAEAEQPTEGGYRIFRMSRWGPTLWSAIRSPASARRAEVVRWERDTLLPNHGLVEGIESTYARSGSVEHDDFELFFQPFIQQIDAKLAEAISARPGQDVYCFPRMAFDLWNTRYFLLPIDPADWNRPNRALISFLDSTERIYPKADQDPSQPRLTDFQVRRNKSALPRAWTVHDFIAVDPAVSEGAAEMTRQAVRHLARGTAVTPGTKALTLTFDPRTTALIETETPESLAPYRSGQPADPAETPRIIAETPQRVELAVTLQTPGLVILGHRFDQGWHASVDGQPAPILKTNRLMRAVALEAGPHRIVYSYDPMSFRVGAAISLLALVPLAITCVWAARGGRAARAVRASTPTG